MYTAILFDLDGTLTDPALGITRAIQYALTRLAIVEPDPERLRGFIGPPLLPTFQQHYGLTREEALRALALYRDYYATTGLYENEVYPAIPALLERLHAQGRHLLVATAKPTVFAERILSHFALRHYFDAVVGSTLDQSRTTKSEVIAHLLSEQPALRGQPVVMVGDREHDIHGGQAHGLATIGVTYGFGSLAELQAAGPTAIADSVAELATLLGSQPG